MRRLRRVRGGVPARDRGHRGDGGAGRLPGVRELRGSGHRPRDGRGPTIVSWRTRLDETDITAFAADSKVGIVATRGTFGGWRLGLGTVALGWVYNTLAGLQKVPGGIVATSAAWPSGA